MPMPWHKRNPDLYAAEMSAVRRRYPDVAIQIERGKVCLKGLFPVQAQDGSTIRRYHLAMEFPVSYPEWVPDCLMLESTVQHIADRHMDANGRACLCLPHEVPAYFPEGIRFETYAERLLTPWLVGQAYFDVHGRWPPWPTRDHGMDGIIQGFADLLGISDTAVIDRYARLLVRESPAKGHEVCPCGSGRKLRDCHEDLYRRSREAIPKPAIKMYRKYYNIYDQEPTPTIPLPSSKFDLNLTSQLLLRSRLTTPATVIARLAPSVTTLWKTRF
jgi:hypothetical protein